MDVNNEVYLKSDPSKVGVVGETKDDKDGRTQFLVFWNDGSSATWHYKPELGEVPARRHTNIINGNSTGIVIQAGVIKGNVDL